ncbi:MAG: glycine--tRNA ligase [Candidatus Aenigmarchaeota archaeon]|nr:glycine--tRNA ligase [Candidatus Aenigmarchaeota archaeon]
MEYEKIMDMAKRRGIFWQSAGIYKPVAGFYDYGHIGTLIKRRWENLWREFFLGLGDNYYEIQASVIMPEDVFRASGHLESFLDPVAKCGKCGNVERADHILEDLLKESFEGMAKAELTALIRKHNIKCEKCKGSLGDVEDRNLMFPVSIGTGKDKKSAYLTGETAQGAYVNFKLMFDVLRRRLPMGLAIVGKAFRHEISPRQALIRMREFTQAELQIFFDSDAINKHPRFDEVGSYKLRLHTTKNKSAGVEEMSCHDAVKGLHLPEFYVYHLARVQQFYLDVLAVPEKAFRLRELSAEEKAFYNKYHWDIQLNMESVGGWKEVGGVHYRADHDLKGHGEASGTAMAVNIEGKSVLPHVIEISMGVDRNVYALVELSYREEKERDVLAFPRKVAPFDAGIFPLVNKDGLEEKAREIYEFLRGEGFQVFFDSSGSIGRRYRRIDEVGVPAGITIDYDTLKDNDVTLRDRDSMKQVRVKIKDMPAVLRRFLGGESVSAFGEFIN